MNTHDLDSFTSCKNDHNDDSLHFPRPIGPPNEYAQTWQNTTGMQVSHFDVNDMPYVECEFEQDSNLPIEMEVDRKRRCHGKCTRIRHFYDILQAHAYDKKAHRPPAYLDIRDFNALMSHYELILNKKAVQRLDVDIFIPWEVKFILSFGPKFSVPIPLNNARCELLFRGIRQLNEFHMAVYERRTLTAIAKEHLLNMRSAQLSEFSKRLQFFVIHCYNCTLRFFHENPCLVIAMADKGNITIVMKKMDYIQKVESHLADTKTYTELNVSCNAGFMTKNRSLLKKFINIDFLHANDVPNIMSSESKIPNMYGLVKLHKVDKPIRPVVNTRSGPGCRLSAILTKVFTATQESHKYNVKNSADVLHRLSNVTPDPDEFLVTFDIDSMFTNVSVDMAMISILRRYDLGKFGKRIPRDLLIDTIRFVLCHSTEIQFNNRIYKQICGLKWVLLCPLLLLTWLSKICLMTFSRQCKGQDSLPNMWMTV